MSSNNANNSAISTTQTQVTATIKSRPNIMPSSYLYTSSSALLNRNNNPENKPAPPPTLPKYTSSFNAGSGGLNRDRDKDSIGGSYRLSSLDRLAMRQKFMDQQSPTNNGGTLPSSQGQSSSLSPQINGDSSTPTINGPTLSNKREIFFSGAATSTPENPHNNKEISSSSARLNKTPSIENNNNKSPLSVPDKQNKETFNNNDDGGNNPSKVGTIKENLSNNGNKPAAAAASTENNNNQHLEVVKNCCSRIKELDGYVGFASLPDQVYRKAVKKGFEFTLMVVGESGLGKSTLINSMFLTEIYNASDYPGPTQRLKKTVAVETTRVMLKEGGVNLLLTMVDTPGFGDAVDNSNCWAPIIEFIESKYEDYLNSEIRVTRQTTPDQRVHCCLYFIQPSGHGLKSLDIEFMKRLCDKVNIIPVIAKADTLTAEECDDFKKEIMCEITQHKIKIYEFPETCEEDVEHKLNKSLKERVPFAVVGSNTVIECDGKKIRGRKYPWGIAEVENLEHCDFLALRNMVIRTHLQDLKDVTNNVHYENYRCRKLAALGADGKPSRISNKNPLAQMAEEKREHDAKMKKMETEMEQVFEMKVREKKQKLKDSESELTRRHEATKKQLEQQAKELEEKRRQFEMEKENWEKENQITIEDLRRRSLEGSRETMDGKKEKKKKSLF